MDHIADFLIPPDDDHEMDGRSQEITSATINSGIWGNSLPYEILLDIQKVEKCIDVT